jgi:endogenous inhibitor of DNA gyrase (YacG/DUF329 family)
MERVMTCPICSKAASGEHRPFCSKRCADIDLSRWLKGGYAIPGREMGEEGEGQGSEAPNDDENRGLKGMDRE